MFAYAVAACCDLITNQYLPQYLPASDHMHKWATLAHDSLCSDGGGFVPG